MAQVYSNPERETDNYALPDIETFYQDQKECDFHNNAGHYEYTPGWYWWSCFPGCLPDSDPIGPFATEQEAIDDAQDY